METEKEPCKGAFGKFAFAFITGAGVATTAILIANQVRKAASADHLLKKCSRAVDALDSQIQQPLSASANG